MDAKDRPLMSYIQVCPAVVPFLSCFAPAFLRVRLLWEIFVMIHLAPPSILRSQFAVQTVILSRSEVHLGQSSAP